MSIRILYFAVVSGVAAVMGACTASSPTVHSPVAATAPVTAPSPVTLKPAPAATNAISWDAAKSHVGETLTVTGPVVGTHVTKDGSHFNLNIGKDFPSQDRFTVFLATDPNAPDPDTVYVGKTVTVTGKIVLFQKVPEIKAALKDLQIAK